MSASHEQAFSRQEQELRERLADIVLGQLVMPHDGKYRTERVTKTVDQIWLAMRAYRGAVLDEAAMGRTMAL